MELSTDGELKRRFPAHFTAQELASLQENSNGIRAEARLALRLKELSVDTPSFLMVFPDGSVSIHRAD